MRVRSRGRNARRSLPRVSEFWLCLGDSEMTGIAPVAGLPAGYPPDDTTLWKMGRDLSWTHVSEPISDEIRLIPPFPGVGLPGLFAWRRQQRVGGRVGVVMGSHLGVASDQWAPGGPSGLYAQAVERLRLALAHGGTFRGILLCDGANDANGALTAWATNWAAFLSNIGTDVPAAAGARLVYYQLPATRPNFISDVNWQAVRTLQADFATASRIMVPARDTGPWLSGGSNVQVHLTVGGFDLLAQDFDAATAAF